MKKALIISAAFPPMPAGEGDYAMHLAGHLAGRGFDVHLLTGRQNSGGGNGGLNFTLHARMPGWSWLSLPHLVSFLKKCRPDVVILIAPGWLYNEFHPMMMFAPTVAKALNRNVLFVTQFCYIGDPPPDVPKPARVMRRVVKQWAGTRDVDWTFGTLLRDSDLVAVMTEADEALFSKLGPALKNRLTVIPPPPILHLAKDSGARARGRKQLGVQDGDFLFSFFGYVYPSKGVDTLLKSFREVVRRKPDARLVMIGGGHSRDDDSQEGYIVETEQCSREMRQLARDLGVADRVIWTGGYAADSDQASVYLTAVDACVLPFDQGVSLLRSSVAAALTHGLPVITTRGPRVETPFRDGENILLCGPKDTAELAGAMSSLMDDAGLYGKLRAGSAQLARDWFSWNRLDRGLQQVMGNK